MTPYEDTVAYLFNQLPVFQHIGAAAYKPGLENMLALAAAVNNPHKAFKTIHIAGTNGKGSTSHLLASVLQEAGYRVGLFTSPHLVDFRERIRVNGVPIEKEFVIEFVARYREASEQVQPSFFELTTLMAFAYFAQQQVDIAVIETGLGGRLDATNIVEPMLSIITNISLDHTHLLGNTLVEIAGEKAGIIKPHTPVVIGEAEGDVRAHFRTIAQSLQAPIYYADEECYIEQANPRPTGGWVYSTSTYPELESELGGVYQQANAATVLTAVVQLQVLGYPINEAAVRAGFAQVIANTGLQGRWQQIATNPTTICDTAHNTAGIAQVVAQLAATPYHHLHIVLGMVGDKDIEGVLSLLPPTATYYFCQPSIARALPATQLQQQAAHHQLQGNSYATVAAAYHAAKVAATPRAFIYIGGSSFVVADLLVTLDKE